MESYIIHGGYPLQGEVIINGAKNSALGLLAASIMSDEPSILSNVPNVDDVNHLIEVIENIGGEIQRIDEHTIDICGGNINPELSINYDYVKKMRASYYLLGALLGKYNIAKVALPGGCEIGSRPIDQHFKGFKALGATIKLENGIIIAEAKELKGTKIYLDIPSVGATINLMLVAVKAKGHTQIINVAKEPHVVDVANLLITMGAKIEGAGTDVIDIYGVDRLDGVEYSVIPDQIEAGTFMISSFMTNGLIKIKNIIPNHLQIIAYKLKELGANISFGEDFVIVDCQNINRQPINVVTAPYPGFPTDLQPQISVACGLANGSSFIKETIFENRYCYVDEVSRMGANMKVSSNTLAIEGIKQYKQAIVSVPDLRAGAALVLAALNASGESIVQDIQYIKRGYENLDIKIRNLGGFIEIIKSR